MEQSDRLALLSSIYGEGLAPTLKMRIDDLLASRAGGPACAAPWDLTERDALLIAYPDQVQAPNEPPLRTLATLADAYLDGLISTIHVLPFFPSSSDDGFAVTDYESVDLSYGDWSDIERLGRNFALVFDAVINHASAQGQWFQGFLQSDEQLSGFFIEVGGKPDLRSVVRPRTTPLVTELAGPTGTRSIWTTFSADQVDLNYRNPEVLLRVLDVLLSYAARGARFIRLDAVGFLWKEIGTSCIHLPQTHAIVRLIRDVMQAGAPQVRLITETNVTQSDNLRYLGGGTPEAHLAYNFALPPLVLHAFHASRAVTLTDWAAALPELPVGTTLLNILATHDGIGLNGCRGFLGEPEIAGLADSVTAAGGYVSRRSNSRSGSDPYELNINYMDALDAVAGDATREHTLARFVSAHAIMLSLKGMPALYFHSFFGSRGWKEGVRLSGQPRSINRQKLDYSELRFELEDPRSLRSRVNRELARFLRARQGSPAFSPFARQDVLRAGSGLFALTRGEAEGSAQVLCLHNVTREQQLFDCAVWEAGCEGGNAVDMVSGRTFEIQQAKRLTLEPYESLWLRIVGTKQGAAHRDSPRVPLA